MLFGVLLPRCNFGLEIITRNHIPDPTQILGFMLVDLIEWGYFEWVHFSVDTTNEKYIHTQDIPTQTSKSTSNQSEYLGGGYKISCCEETQGKNIIEKYTKATGTEQCAPSWKANNRSHSQGLTRLEPSSDLAKT